MNKLFNTFSYKRLLFCAFLIVIASFSSFPRPKIYNQSDLKIIYNYYTKAREFAANNELDSAVYYNKLVLNIYTSNKDTANSVKVLDYIARLFWKKYEHDSTLVYINAGLALLSKNSANMKNDKANLYSTLGVFYLNLGDYANAAIYTKLALNIRQEFQAAIPEMVESYTILGRIEFNLEHYDEAIKYYQKAMKSKFYPTSWNTRMLANNCDNIGNALLKKNNIVEAKKYFLKGFAYSPRPVIYLDLGKLFVLEKKYAAADTSLRKALELYLLQYGEKHNSTSKCYSALGDLYKAKKDYEKAYFYYTKGLNSSIKSSEEKFFAVQNHSFYNIISIKAFCISLEGKAKMLLELAKMDSTEARLFYAKKMLMFSIPLLSTIQKYYLLDDSKLKLRELADKIMNLGVETCYELYKITNDQKYILQGFIFSETKRNSVLNESKTKREAMFELNIPDSLKKAELKLKHKLNQLFSSTEEKVVVDTAEEVNTIERENLIVNTINAYDSLLAKIKRNYPKYASLVLSEEMLTMKDIRENFKDNIIVEYTITKENIFLFCITKESVMFIKKAKKQSFEKLINDYRSSLKKIDKKTYLSTARDLYSELILPIEKELINKKKLTIIPCSELALLPFEALITPEGSMLLEKASIQYVGSSNYFGKNRKESTNHYPYYFVGIAPSYDKQKNYTELKNNEEINGISGLLKIYNLRDTLFAGDNATEENLINSNDKCNILHIAAHSFADTLNEGKSGIVFNEKILTAAEIIANEFNNDLVVLSSCEGGNGKTVSGEGVLSLARNFLRAGAKNALVALWKVPDKQTRLFMMEFYNQLVKDNDYAEALSRAKRILIKNKLFAFPNTWSAFVLMK